MGVWGGGPRNQKNSKKVCASSAKKSAAAQVNASEKSNCYSTIPCNRDSAPMDSHLVGFMLFIKSLDVFFTPGGSAHRPPCHVEGVVGVRLAPCGALRPDGRRVALFLEAATAADVA